MKVTLVLGYLAKGGTERQVAYLASGLAQRGHQVRILLLGHHFDDDYPVATGVEVIALQITNLRYTLAGWRKLRAAFRSSDVVYSFLDVANALCALAKPRRAASLVWGLRAANTSSGRVARVGLWLSQRLCSRADALVANSQAVCDYYLEQGIRADRTLVIANGVRSAAARQGVASASSKQQHRDELQARLKLPAQSYVGLVLARDAAEKRQELGIRLLEKNPDLYLVYAGDGVSLLADRWRQQALCSATVLERCRFLEHQTDVAWLLQGADVLLSLSTAEGSPNALLEAMANRLPVVATAVGGVPELLTLDSEPDALGWLVPMVEADADIAGIDQALGEVQHGGAQVQQRIALARQCVETKFSVERMVEHTTALLAELG